ncbi:MAG: T9SS type A sorting domain-containing protein [Candidatus Kapabacteria bacterium]|nr:T9SS type A sorting domain-containing protein [Candidatus Kapabacteria bacterium]
MNIRSIFSAAFVAVCLASSPLFAQFQSASFQMIDPTLVLYVPDINSTFEDNIFHLKTKNKSLTSVTYQIKVDLMGMAFNHRNQVCVGTNCYDAKKTETIPELIASGGEIDAKGQFSPGGNMGVSTLTYTFINTKDVSDFVSATITIYAGVSSVGMENVPVATVAPNPASSVVTVTLPQSVDGSTLEIINALGSVVDTYTLENGTNMVLIPTSGLATGAYQLRVRTATSIISKGSFVVVQ